MNTDKPTSGPAQGTTRDRRDDSGKTTPATDMQAEDAGTDASGQPGSPGAVGSTPAEKAMKQQSKTDEERR